MLDQAEIEYSKDSNAGFFLWIDLVPYLPKTDSGDLWEAEGLLTQAMFEAGVFILGGQAQMAEEPGHFRLCFSQPEEALREGLRRMVDAPGQTETSAGQRLRAKRIEI